MKLSFSTRGWQRLGWDELLESAVESGMNGIELYDLFKREDLIERGAPFDRYHAVSTVRKLRERGMAIPCLDSSIDLTVPDAQLDELSFLIETAGSIRTPYVSVVALGENEDLARERIAGLLPKCEKAEVTLLVKTTGIYADTGRLRALMDDFASDFLAALWDIHHPCHDCGEDADTTIKNLGAYVRHVHIRDSDEQGTYNIIGEGALPVDEMIRAFPRVEAGMDGGFGRSGYHLPALRQLHEPL